MKRRPFLASIVGGLTLTVSGCTEGAVVQEIQDSALLDPLSGEAWKINEVGGVAELSYSVRSEDHSFQVFYFTERSELLSYQNYVHGDRDNGEQPTGLDRLRKVAVPNEDGIFVAERPSGGGRLEIEIDSDHFLVVDYSNYDQNLHVDRYSDDLRVYLELEVVEESLF